MFNLVKEMPFADTLGPICLAALLWTGAHMTVIAPGFVAPRLAEKYYHPGCEIGLKKAFVKAKAIERSKIKQAIDQKQAKLRQTKEMTEALFGKFFGRELGQRLKNSGLLDPLKGLPPSLLENDSGTLMPALSADFNPKDYCGCIITHFLYEQISTGLYSASLRLWKPDNIRQLENLASNPVTTPHCPKPAFLKH